MASILDLVDPARFAASVAHKLARWPAERAVFAPLAWTTASPRGEPPRSPDRVRAIATRAAETALAAQLAALAKPEDPRLLRVVSWQYGASAAKTEVELREAARARVELAVQNHEHALATAAHWAAALAPDPATAIAAWNRLALAQHAAGRWAQAQASLSAARALGDRPAPLVFDGEDPRPERAKLQPSTRFRGQPWKQRHWLAWDCKNYGIVDVPTLVDAARDESFIVRARVYRSLGQLGHTAAIASLREGLGDAHPFARAQAVRALGWIGDAGSVARLALFARRDGDPEVQRASRQALARILALWERWGEFDALFANADELRAFAKKLRTAGGFGDVHLPVRDAPSCGRESARIEGHRYEYSAWFADAQAEAESLARSRG